MGVDLNPILGVHGSLGPPAPNEAPAPNVGGLVVYDVPGFSELNGLLPFLKPIP